MKQHIIPADILFNVTDVFSRNVRITKRYWRKIIQIKHRELEFEPEDVAHTLKNPDSVYRSIQDNYIQLFYKKYKKSTLVVVVKYLNGDGFVVTVYQTNKAKRKGEKIWQK